MARKSGYRFSEKAMRQQKDRAGRPSRSGDWGSVIEDKTWFSCLRSAGRFVSLRWLCVRLLSPYPLVRHPHGLTMAQGGMPAPGTPGIMRGITLTSGIGI
jgi:hypothetical protein